MAEVTGIVVSVVEAVEGSSGLNLQRGAIWAASPQLGGSRMIVLMTLLQLSPWDWSASVFWCCGVARVVLRFSEAVMLPLERCQASWLVRLLVEAPLPPKIGTLERPLSIRLKVRLVCIVVHMNYHYAGF